MGASARVLGEGALPSAEAALVEAGNRLARESADASVLIFRALDQADAATVRGLTDILQHPGWLALPLVLEVTAEGAQPELEEVVRSVGGAVVEAPAGEQPPAVAWDWRSLPSDVLQVLRAGAAVGPVFEVDIVAHLLGLPPLLVLDRLQLAADAGAPLVDRGEGRLSLPSKVAAALRESMLPSLLHAWHARLAESLAAPTARDTEPSPRGVEPPASAWEPARPQARTRAASDTRPPPRVPRHQVAPDTVMCTSVGPVAGSTGSALPRDEARAAAHFEEAGQTEAAGERYLAAARRLGDQGDIRRAREMVERALPLIQRIVSRPVRAESSARAHLTLARLQWQGSGRSQDSSLQDALESVQAARAALSDEVPAALLADLAATRAGVCYDVGDEPSLRAALAELVDASQALLAAGETVEAARLLNDQAAIHLRLDDPMQAVTLLNRSRELFERLRQQNPSEPMLVEELAETHHLLARVPLHALSQRGREAEGIDMALDHAQTAERLLSELSNVRGLGRLWETMARLQLARGDVQAAAGLLGRAADVQKRLGDAIGLARSAAGYADLLVSAGRPEEAVSALAESIALNYEKGSPLGLAFNRSSLTRLRATLAPGAEALRESVRRLEEELSGAEQVLGRMPVPPA